MMMKKHKTKNQKESQNKEPQRITKEQFFYNIAFFSQSRVFDRSI